MLSLLFQTCTIKKKIKGASTDGTPSYSETTIESGVKCRLDTAISRVSQSTEKPMSQSNVEEMRGILYLMPRSDIDETCYVYVDGDSRMWQFVNIHQSANSSAIHHLEIDVKTSTHR